MTTKRATMPLLHRLGAGGLEALFLSLCACVNVYVPPVDGEVAQIKLMGSNYVYISPDGSCKNRMLVDIKDRERYVNLRSGQRIFVEQGVDSGGSAFSMHCAMAVTFTPQPGKKYVSIYTLAGTCQMGLYEVDARGSKVAVPSLERTTPLNCW